MAAPGGTKKKKKGQVGGQTGKPAFSEPRVQVFSKFAGCNFQLAVRDFDNLLGEDQDTQTDLMPMLMAVQNNAHIAPMGGIETRQNIVKIFEPPFVRNPLDPESVEGEQKSLTGVATLIGDRLFVACSDESVHYGEIVDGEVSGLDDMVELVDLNDTYGQPQRYSYESPGS